MPTCPDFDNEETDPSVFFNGSSINWKRHYIGWAIAGGCALLATIISFSLLHRHARNYTKPSEQRHIMRIVLMIPIYSIISFLSYRFYKSAIYYETIRNCYEAFVIYSFFILLLEYLGDDSKTRKARIPGSGERRKLIFPLNCFTYNPQSEYFLQWMKYGVLQYVVVKPIVTIASVVLQAKGLYCDTTYSFAFGKVYLTIINFISVTVAMYCLVIFYMTIKTEIQEQKPFLKFLCVKLVIFFCFWQTILLSLLGHFNVFKATEYWSVSNIEIGISALLICVEMVIFAILHVYSFSYTPYVTGKETPVSESLRDGFNPMDIVYEIGWACKDIVCILTGKPLPVREGHLSGVVKRANTIRAGNRVAGGRNKEGSSAVAAGDKASLDDASLESGKILQEPLLNRANNGQPQEAYQMSHTPYSSAQQQQWQQQQQQPSHIQPQQYYQQQQQQQRQK